MRRRAIAAVGLTLLLAAGCEYTVEPLNGVEGQALVYAAVGKGGAPNSGFVLTSQGVVVIDPGLNPDYGLRLNNEAYRRSRNFWELLHVNLKRQPRTLAPPVLYVLNTTYRGSHSFGSQAFLESADIVATEKAARHMASLQQVQKMRQVLDTQFKVPGLEALQPTTPIVSVDGTFTLNTAEATVRFISVGDCVGEGDAVVYLPQHKILFAGDLVLAGFMPYYEGRTLSVLHWIEVLRQIEQWPIEKVVPGHGAVGGRELVVKQREFLEALVAAVRVAIAKGLTAQQAAAQIALPNQGAWANYREWLGENVKLVHAELSNTTKAEAAPRGSGATAAAPGTLAGGDLYR